MFKYIFVIYIFFLLLPVLEQNISFADDKTGTGSATLTGFQEIRTEDDFLSNDLPSMKGMIKSFAIVIVLIALFFVFLKWRYKFFQGAKGSKKHIQVLEYSVLGPKKSIYLVKVLDKLLVIGATNDGLHLLCEMNESEKSEMIGNAALTGESFSGILKKKV